MSAQLVVAWVLSDTAICLEGENMVLGRKNTGFSLDPVPGATGGVC